MNEMTDQELHAAVSDWTADEWKAKYDALSDQVAREGWKTELRTLKHLLSESLMFVQHDPSCCWQRDPRLGCDCGLDVWGEMVKNAIGFYDDDA